MVAFADIKTTRNRWNGKVVLKQKNITVMTHLTVLLIYEKIRLDDSLVLEKLLFLKQNKPLTGISSKDMSLKLT